MDLEVKPEDWVISNRIGYNKYIYKTFNPSKYPKKQQSKGCECEDDVCDIPSDTVSLFPQQRIVRDFIQVNSPYRGILLYHELGSGKSAASIAAAEGYIGKKKVFVFSPASLAQNFENELMKVSHIGLNMKKSWSLLKVSKSPENTQKLKDVYAISEKFVKKDGLVWLPLYQNDLADSVIVTDKKKYSTLTNDDKNKIDETISHIIHNRYTFVSYNGLTQKLVTELVRNTFDDSFVIIDEVHNFISRTVNGSRLARQLYNQMLVASNCKMVFLSGTPIINNPYEIASLINLIRGPMTIYEMSLLKDSIEPSTDQLIDELKKKKKLKYIDEINFDTKKRAIVISLLPNGYVKKSDKNIAVIGEDWGKTDKDMINEIIADLNKITKLRVKKIPSRKQYYALPDNKQEFDEVFIDLTNENEPKLKNEDLFKRRILGTLSYYKTSGTEFFPRELEKNIRYIYMTDHQMNLYSDVRKRERDMDKSNRMKTGAMDDKSSVYRAFSRMFCNFVFPEEIKRSFPQDIRKLNKQLDANEYDEDELDVKEDKSKAKEDSQQYAEEMEKAVKDVSKGDYLSKENLKNLYSPKFAKMIDDIEESPGTVLVYSQFRTIEGLGLFSKALDYNGYKEIVIKKSKNEYVFEDISVFDKKYDGKRYVIFNSDKTKTNILMNLFNGSFASLPDSIIAQFKENEIEYDDQLYGNLVKAMMITQSGAEGISLKNVRRVLIMEYFWNAVRINQVIGRAVRTCSHAMLPEDQRTVEKFIYIMKFTKKQIEKNFTIQTQDKSLTTDEHIYALANKKENIINQFMNMLKAASFDCIINSVQNQPLKNGYKCYNWAINSDENELSYTRDYKTDSDILKHMRFQKPKLATGTVVRDNDGKKFVLLNDKLYDYFSYKNAGILMAV